MTRPGNAARFKSLVVALAICFLAVAANGLLTSVSVGGWYQGLAKPPFNPPDWVFAPAWNLLFLLMALALWRAWNHARPGRQRRRAMGLFGIQLGLNMLWSALFFALRAPGWALVEVVLLEGMIVATIVAFWRVDRLAGALLVPYAAWVAFATLLNGAIWWLN